MKRIITIVLILLVVSGISLWIFSGKEKPIEVPKEIVEEKAPVKQEVIGHSVENRAIEAYTFGNGSLHLLFVGGIHGGYEWNSVILAYTFIDYLTQNPDVVPKNLTISVIPSANPDGVFKVIGKEGKFALTDVKVNKEESKPGRFNAHEVDLNRNFDCKWKPQSMWQEKVVSSGTAAFSEPETAALRDFILKYKPAAAVFWHSQANAVYASECKEGILPETLDIMNAYAKAAGYPAVKSFDSYEVTGDAEGWLASIHTPAITVELETHETVEWEKNLLGIKALFEYYHYE